MAKIQTPYVQPGYEIADGIPHMTYQNPQFDVNFVWDGVIEHPIMVCPNGYGEPPTQLISLELEVCPDQSPARALAWFAMRCEEFLDHAPESWLRSH